MTLSRARRHVGRFGLLLALFGSLAGCSALGLDGESGERARLERQKALWARQHLSSYRFTYERSCFCGGFVGPIDIEVRTNSVVAAANAETDQPLPLETISGLPTVDALFRIIERAILDQVALLDVTYHPTRGYPTRIALDYAFNVADDEFLHVVTALTAIAKD